MSALAERLARELGEDALVAREPVPVVAPTSIEAASAALRLAARDGLRVAPAGSRAHSDGAGEWDLILSSTRMRRVLEYEPADLVAVVESGIPLAALDAVLAANAQRLGPDPWAAGEASVGGAVAADRCGLSRRGRGTWRDAVLGARVVEAGGQISKTGGRVVKNVAGFDLAKLYVGSCGSLVWIAELALRLVPRPATARTLVQPCMRAAAQARLLDLHRQPLGSQALLYVEGSAVPRGVSGNAAGGSGAIIVRFEGAEPVVQAQVRAATEAAGAWDEVDAAGWDALRCAVEPQVGCAAVRAGGRGTGGIAWLDACAPAALRAAIVQFGAGVLHLQVEAGDDVTGIAARIAQAGARSRVEPSGRAFDPMPDAVAHDLAVANKQAFDPGGMFPQHPELTGIR